MKILLADDHQLVRQGLRTTMERLSAQVELLEAESLDQVISELHSHGAIDLIMLDLRMPGMKGFNGLERVRAGWPEVPVVILSASSDGRDIEDALEHGAAGYIPKSLTVEATFAALQQVLRGELFDPRRRAETAERDAKAEFAELSPRERCVLGYLAQGRSNKDIARRLDLQEVTVKAHLRQVFRKLGVANRTQAVKRVLQAGWNG
jgi:DNA-binding NarL/FixJ family response regulator